jgi:DNA-binding transcriptional ArsR family regulator
MARNSQSALYINDPVKIVAGVFTVRQALYVAGIVLLTYGLITTTSRLPYGQSGLGQLHLLLIVGLPALLTLLVVTFAGSGTVEPYARQIAGYLWRTALATPRRLAHRATRLVAGRRHAPAGDAPAGDAPASGATSVVGDTATAAGAGGAIRAAGTDDGATRAPAPALTLAPVVTVTPLMATPLAQAQRARLLAWLAAHPGATNEEIADGATLTPSAVRPRRRELEAAGLVRKVDTDGRTRAGRRAARWEVVPHG